MLWSHTNNRVYRRLILPNNTFAAQFGWWLLPHYIGYVLNMYLKMTNNTYIPHADVVWKPCLHFLWQFKNISKTSLLAY